MKRLMEYCSANYIRLQLKKCAVMCVNGDEEDQQPIEIDDLLLNQTKCEVYLGSGITNSTKLIDDVNADIKNRQISVVKFYAFLRTNHNAPVDVKLKVNDACILTSILYNSETWANANITRLEVVYRRMLRSIIGVGSSTCNEILYIELGVPSIKTKVMMKQFEFWRKVREMDEENPIKYIIREAKRFKLKEVEHYEQLLEKFDNKEQIRDQFFEETRNAIRQKAREGRSKYVTYMQINNDLTTPTCYDNIKHSFVAMIGKLRTSTHSLHIEMGRRSGTARERRFCHCGLGVEDEKHFLLDCEVYRDIRRKHGVDVGLEEVLGDNKFVPYNAELMEKRRSVRQAQSD